MKISLNWLKRYVDVPIDVATLAGKLTMVGLEVESIERQGEKYDGFTIGQVLSVERHPKADRLTVCQVQTGGGILQIVCGAPNVAAGQKVVAGGVGAVVPHDQHDSEGKPFTLAKVRLRGVDSSGMICSRYELDLGEDKEGIWVLPPDSTVGDTLEQYLGLDDTILEVGITPNRPDAMSHIGIAREVAAILGSELRMPISCLKEASPPATEMISISIDDPVNAPRYSARILKDVKIGPSPAWLQKLLTAVGLRPVNNVVDVTNFVLMENGQPLHAFDYDLLRGKQIVVRSTDKEEKFVTLDGKERLLPGGTLMICDGSGPVAVAGVMGGRDSEISPATQTVLIESAYFNSTAVRKSSKRLGLSTDASQRFERGADPSITITAVDRASALLQEIGGATVLSGVIDVCPNKLEERTVRLRIGRLNAVLGSNLKLPQATDLLQKIGIARIASSPAAGGETEAEFRIPTFRPDLEREIDLIEEVARLNGYENIEVRSSASIAISNEREPQDGSAAIADWLVGRGFNQTVINSMQSYEIACIGSDAPVRVKNPLSGDMAALRTCLATGMLQILSGNIRRGNKNLRLFELGRVYSRVAESTPATWVPGYREEERLLLAMSGNSTPIWWDAPSRKVDLFDIRGEVETLFAKLGLDKFQFIPYPTTNALTQDGLAVEIQGAVSGWLGKIRSDMLKSFDIDQDVYVAELTVTALTEQFGLKRKFNPLPVYPSIIRDLAVVVEAAVPMADILHEVRVSAGSLLADLQLFDIYRGDQVQSGKKSCALALEFRSPDRTLSQEDADRSIQAIMEHLSKKFNATLRA
jgi:phenylalanyl-tRNA synthetase beta chain